MEILSKSPQDTQNLAFKLANNIRDGGVICLYGQLGAGKTVFVQGLAKALKIKRPVLSPTFLMMRNYNNFYHLDLYRINNFNDAKTIGLEEVFDDQSNIIVIEWAEKIEKILPTKRFDINFEIIDEQSRKITVNKRS